MNKNTKKRHSSKLPKFIPQNEVLKILSCINTKCWMGLRNHTIIMVLYRAGLRVSELCKLTLPDVNFNTEMIYVQQGKGKKDRYVPMDFNVKQSLKNWLKIRLVVQDADEYLFCTSKGRKLSDRYVREMCYRTSEKAGVYIQDGTKKKPVSPHKFRHSCFTELLREGDFNIREIQQIAGHKSINTTMIYTHVVTDDIQKKMRGRKRLTIS